MAGTRMGIRYRFSDGVLHGRGNLPVHRSDDMNAPAHAILGAAAGILPDAVLATYGWRRRWVPYDHPLVRAHKFLHSPRSLPLILALAWSSHLIADRFSQHRG